MKDSTGEMWRAEECSYGVVPRTHVRACLLLFIVS